MRITAFVYFAACAATAPLPVLFYPGLHDDDDGMVRTGPGNEPNHPIRIDPPSSQPKVISCDPRSLPQAPCLEVPKPPARKPGRPGPGPGPMVKKCKFLFLESRCTLIPRPN